MGNIPMIGAEGGVIVAFKKQIQLRNGHTSRAAIF
jgi:hypothetical protein